MLTDAGRIVEIVLVVGVIAIAGVAMLQLGTVRALRETNDDLRKRDEDRKGTIVELEAKVVTLTQERDVMSKMVTGEAHLAQIEGQLNDHHRESMQAWDRITSVLRDIADGQG